MKLSVILILLIPAFIAFGHDCYLFYMSYLNPGMFSIDLLMEKFKFSALGYIWTAYGRESFDAAVHATAPDPWSTIDLFLTFKAFYVALAFAGIMTLLFLFLKMFGRGPFAGEREVSTKKGKKKGKKGEESFRSGTQSKKITYKRK